MWGKRYTLAGLFLMVSLGLVVCGVAVTWSAGCGGRSGDQKKKRGDRVKKETPRPGGRGGKKARRKKRRKKRKRKRPPLQWGRALIREGRYHKAVGVLQKAVKSHSTDTKVLNEYAYALYLHRDYEKAFLMALEALKVAKKRRWKSAILYNIGRIFEEAPWPPKQSHWHPAFLFFHAYLMRPNGTVLSRLKKEDPGLVKAMGTPDIDLAAKELLATRTKLCSLLELAKGAKPQGKKEPSASKQKNSKAAGVKRMATLAHSRILAKAICVSYKQAMKKRLQPEPTSGGVDLPGKCRLMVAPKLTDAEDSKEPPPNGYGQGGGPVYKTEADLNGDGIKDLFLALKKACDGRNNCYFAVYLSKGKCGHYAGTIRSRPGDLKILGEAFRGFKVVQGTDAYHGGLDETRYRFDGKIYTPFLRNACYQRRCSGWKAVR